MKIKTIYEDSNVLVTDKPAGIIVFLERKIKEKTLIGLLLKYNSALKNTGEKPRYGIVHRLDKDTSGILLTAKNNKSLIFFQKQFKQRSVEKKYIVLVVGNVKNNQGVIETLIGRSKKQGTKQKVYLASESGSKGKREAITKYKVIERFKDYTLLEVSPKTGRMHQIRTHFAYINHPIAGDKKYGFKNQPCPEELKRQFLHASYLKIKLLNNRYKELNSTLAPDLKLCLQNLKKNYQT